MTEFLVELYISREDRSSLERGVELARVAAAEMTNEGTPIRYVRSIFIPEDETCFFLYEAASADSVRAAARRARLSFERVSEAADSADPSPLVEPKGEQK